MLDILDFEFPPLGIPPCFILCSIPTWGANDRVPVSAHYQYLVLLGAPGRALNDGDDVGACYRLTVCRHLK